MANDELPKDERAIAYHHTDWLKNMTNTGREQGIYGSAARLLARREENPNNKDLYR